MLSKNKLFIFFWITFLIWIFINNLFFSFLYSFILIIWFILLNLVFYFYYKKYFYYILSLIVWFIFWIIISYINLLSINNNELSINNFIDWNNHKVVLEIDSTYKVWETSRDYISTIYSIDDKEFSQIKFLLKVPLNFELDKWDILEQEIKFKKVENFNDTFNYVKYLELKNIYWVYNTSVPNIIWKAKINWIISNINSFRTKFINIINNIYPRDEALFLWWILIWARESLPKELSDSFNNSWLTHLIAVSWYNITIIIVFITYLLKIFPIVLRVILITISIVLFTILVWDNSAVLRASIMWLLWYYILLSWRWGNAFSLLLLTAIVMVLINPFYLNYDLSFQLSFLAVLWLLYTWDFFKKIFRFLPEKFAIQESFVLTLSAFTFTLPIMIFNFGQLTLFAPISNMLVWWSIPFAMFFWFLSILWYLITPIIWIIIGGFTYLFLKYVIEMVYFFWWLDFSIIKFNFWELALYVEILYFMIIIFLILYNKKID